MYAYLRIRNWWKTTFDGRRPLMEDTLWCKRTFDKRRPLLDDDPLSKMTFDGRRPLMEDNKDNLKSGEVLHIAGRHTVLDIFSFVVFLSSANKVSTGPTCQFLCVCVSVCLCVCLFVFPVFFSRRLIGWYTCFWQWFWQPIYPTRFSELGWAVTHSDFLAWQSIATLKNFISGVSSRILIQ